VDTYIDVDVPYPDAKVASILCGPWGSCKYAARDGVNLYDDFLCSIAPQWFEAFGREVAIILACLLLWAAFEDDVHVHEQLISLIPSDLPARIRAAWSINWRGDNVNPIKKIGLIVSQCIDQLDIIPINVDSNSSGGDSRGGGEGKGGGGPRSGGGDGGFIRQVATKTFSFQIFTFSRLWGICRTRSSP
jgi:hypothetical protein